jgi:hypothetical protein
MLICPRCDMEYDKGETTCGACGSPLVVQENPDAEATQAAPGKRELRKCPKCNMLYEKRTHCLSCGTALVAQNSSPAGEEVLKTADHGELPPAQPARRQPESPREDTVRPVCQTTYETDGPCKKHGNRRGTHDHLEEPEAARSIREPIVKNQNSEEQLQLILEGICPQTSRGERVIPKPLLVAAIILVVLVAGYFPLKRVLVAGPKATPASSPITTTSLQTGVGSAPITKVSPKEQEAERIKGLLETIRQANLREDIDLFMSCYAADFKGLEKKKQTILESWKSSDYLDLSYTLKSQALAADTATIQVEWLVRTTRSATGQLEEGQLLVEALLEKEGESWKIKEIKAIG